ncbi:MAG: DUF4878 domain-containing protein [Bacteroidia bacterium]|nr:DUF4878 domain-containing protein [Bacteroidia bacterium]
MKLKYYFILLSPLLIIGCSENSPKIVAKNFLTASARMDYDAAKKFATPATAKLLDMLSAAGDLTPDSIKKKMESSFEIVKEYKRNDTLAIVLYHLKNSDTDQTLNVVKRDGKWLVNVSKEEFNSHELDLPAEEEEMDGDSISSVSKSN